MRKCLHKLAVGGFLLIIDDVGGYSPLRAVPAIPVQVVLRLTRKQPELGMVTHCFDLGDAGRQISVSCRPAITT